MSAGRAPLAVGVFSVSPGSSVRCSLFCDYRARTGVVLEQSLVEMLRVLLCTVVWSLTRRSGAPPPDPAKNHGDYGLPRVPAPLIRPTKS
jgi:hypothetical protein